MQKQKTVDTIDGLSQVNFGKSFKLLNEDEKKIIVNLVLQQVKSITIRDYVLPITPITGQSNEVKI